MLGKGFDVRIYDPIIQPSRLVGANLHYLQSRLPHLGRILTDSPAQVLKGVDLAVVSSYAISVVDALLGDPPPMILDLTGRLGEQVECLPGYEGVGW